MSALWEVVFSAAFLAAAARRAIPLLAAGTGETISERAGIVNIGLEAMVLAGAFGGVLGAYATGSPWGGLVAGAMAGLLVAAVHGVVVIIFDGDQIVSGVALNIAILGLTTYLGRLIFGIGETPSVVGFSARPVPGLADAPLLGPLVFRQDAVGYLVILAAIAGWYLLERTRWGLEVRSCGESPSAADALGVPVARRRWQALLLCGALAGAGGVHLSLAVLSTFFEGMSGGRGFIALAVVIASSWNPLRAMFVVLLFGGAEALSFRIQAVGIDIPFQLARALPYLLTLAVYAGVIGRVREPAAVGRRWLRA